MRRHTTNPRATVWTNKMFTFTGLLVFFDTGSGEFLCGEISGGKFLHGENCAPISKKQKRGGGVVHLLNLALEGKECTEGEKK